MRVVMSGGGTAGHIYPALSVAAEFAAERDEVEFVGTPSGLEARLVPEAGVAFRGLAAKGFDRARPLTLITSSLLIARSTLTAWRWFGQRRPDVVIGFGGYVSIPVGAAALLRRIPLVLHEQNSVPGMANRLLSRWASAVAVTYPESASLMKRPERVTVTGNPVRPAVLSADGARGRASLGVPSDATMLLVFGGSRGARHLNSALVALRDGLLGHSDLHIVQIAGPAEGDSVRAALDAAGGGAGRWQVLDYLDGMGDALAAADLVIARAGATSIAEITVLGRPAVLVPYPFATDDHQTKNGRALANHSAAVLVSDADLDGPVFAREVFRLLGDAGTRATMSAASRALGLPDAAARVAGLAATAAGSAIAHNHQLPVEDERV